MKFTSLQFAAYMISQIKSSLHRGLYTDFTLEDVIGPLSHTDVTDEDLETLSEVHTQSYNNNEGHYIIKSHRVILREGIYQPQYFLQLIESYLGSREFLNMKPLLDAYIAKFGQDQTITYLQWLYLSETFQWGEAESAYQLMNTLGPILEDSKAQVLSHRETSIENTNRAKKLFFQVMKRPYFVDIVTSPALKPLGPSREKWITLIEEVGDSLEAMDQAVRTNRLYNIAYLFSNRLFDFVSFEYKDNAYPELKQVDSPIHQLDMNSFECLTTYLDDRTFFNLMETCTRFNLMTNDNNLMKCRFERYYGKDIPSIYSSYKTYKQAYKPNLIHHIAEKIVEHAEGNQSDSIYFQIFNPEMEKYTPFFMSEFEIYSSLLILEYYRLHKRTDSTAMKQMQNLHISINMLSNFAVLSPSTPNDLDYLLHLFLTHHVLPQIDDSVTTSLCLMKLLNIPFKSIPIRLEAPLTKMNHCYRGFSFFDISPDSVLTPVSDMFINLTCKNYPKLTGHGYDTMGKFNIEGELVKKKFMLMKHYENGHNIMYEGMIFKNCLAGATIIEEGYVSGSFFWELLDTQHKDVKLAESAAMKVVHNFTQKFIYDPKNLMQESYRAFKHLLWLENAALHRQTILSELLEMAESNEYDVEIHKMKKGLAIPHYREPIEKLLLRRHLYDQVSNTLKEVVLFFLKDPTYYPEAIKYLSMTSRQQSDFRTKLKFFVLCLSYPIYRGKEFESTVDTMKRIVDYVEKERPKGSDPVPSTKTKPLELKTVSKNSNVQKKNSSTWITAAVVAAIVSSVSLFTYFKYVRKEK